MGGMEMADKGLHVSKNMREIESKEQKHQAEDVRVETKIVFCAMKSKAENEKLPKPEKDLYLGFYMLKTFPEMNEELYWNREHPIHGPCMKLRFLNMLDKMDDQTVNDIGKVFKASGDNELQFSKAASISDVIKAVCP